MEIFMIKKQTEIYTVIDEYFFTHLDNMNLPSKLGFFQINDLIQKKSQENYYYFLPFVILSKILKSIDSNKGEFLLSTVFLPKEIWTNTYFNADFIPNLAKKYELFRILGEQIHIFIECYKENRIIDREVFEYLCNFFIEFQNDLSREFPFIQPSDYFPSKTSEMNIETVSIMYKKLLSINEENISRDYILTLKNFLKKSIKLESILNTCDMSNYDYDLKHMQKGEKEYLMNKKVMICKFYTEVVIKLLMKDLTSIILKHMRKNE